MKWIKRPISSPRSILCCAAVGFGIGMGTMLISCEDRHETQNLESGKLLREGIPSLPFSALAEADPFEAVVAEKIIRRFEEEQRTLIFIVLRKEDGSRRALITRAATDRQVQFAKRLEVGKAYSFPRIYLQ